MRRRYSTTEVARMLGLRQPNLQRLIRQKRIPFPPIERAGKLRIRLWTKQDVERARKAIRKWKQNGPCRPLERATEPNQHSKVRFEQMAINSITRVGLYARVSTAGNGQSPEMQSRELHEYCERRGWTVAGEYVDTGISGAKDRRPQLDKLMADAHRRKFDVVAVWKFDRFARSVSHLLRALDTFRVLGIEFVSLSESLDTATPAGRMVFTVLGAVAELERSLIAERVRAGLRNARAKGKRLGRPRVIVDARRMAALRTQGHSIRQIAGELGCSPGLVHKTLADSRKTFVEIAAD